jgi:signal peptidase
MRRWLGTAFLVVLTAAWFVTLRPAPLGGPAAYVVVSGHSMQPALTPGSLVVARRQRSYDVGDVIVYRVPKGEPGAGTRVIHRVIGGSPSKGYITRGDNRKWPDIWRPRAQDVDGAKLVAAPGAGRAVMLFGTPGAIGGMLAVLAFLSAGEPTLPRRRRRERAHAAPALVSAPVAATTLVAKGGGVAVGVAWAGAARRSRGRHAPAPARAPVPVPAPAAVPAPDVAVAPPVLPVAPPVTRRDHRHASRRRHRVVATGGAVVGGAAAAALVARGRRRR